MPFGVYLFAKGFVACVYCLLSVLVGHLVEGSFLFRNCNFCKLSLSATIRLRSRPVMSFVMSGRLQPSV